MDELRATLGLLRGDDGVPPATDQPGVDDIGDLVARATCGAARITFRQDPAPVPVPPLIGFTAYRVVQEALTNIGKHAPDAEQVAVDVKACAERLQVTVVNDGAVRPGPAGHGITGIRERAAAVGGDVTIGPTSGHGFTVDLTLPLRARG
jgi:signal transduction histidine kinase